VEVTASLAEAVGRARADAGDTDIIVITGSLFLVGEAKSLAL
jgi:folylpolyglutamate synthase/dihydropteroate synthase